MNKMILRMVSGVLLLVVGLVVTVNCVTTVDADEIIVKQNFLDGQLQVWNTPGVHWQNFGKLTSYKRSSQYWFSAREIEGKKTDESIKVRFNDGGHGSISGSLRYDLPTDPSKMLALHSTYRSQAAIDHELVRQVVNKSVYMTGPLLSSRESYAEKRSDLINFISDQILHGVYRTERKQTKTIDPLTGQEKTVDYVEPKPGKGPNGIEREEESPFERFALNAYNITINGIEYDPQVEEQIKTQQKAIMAVQEALVNAKKAEQDALTVAKQGEAEAAKAKWTQEVAKATEVTKAEQAKAVAELDLETAKLRAQEKLTTAKADADARTLSMKADNALELRLNTYREVAIAQAQAIGAHRQVPDIQMGGSGNGANSTQQLMDVLAAKTARDLGVQPK